MATSEAEDGDEDEDEASDEALAHSIVFYRGDIRTLVLLHLGTFGLYGLVWFYRQWRAHELTHGTRISAFWRSVFSVYFVHNLFRSIDARARAIGVETRWEPNAQAWQYVGFVVASTVASKVDDELGAIIVAWLCFAAAVLPLAEAQRVSNQAYAARHAALYKDEDEDEDGESDEDEDEDGESDEE